MGSMKITDDQGCSYLIFRGLGKKNENQYITSQKNKNKL